MHQTNLKTRLSSLTFVGLSAGLFLMNALPVQAEDLGLKIQPAMLQVRATPPAAIQTPFTIENSGDTPLDLKIVIKRFRDSGDENGQIVYSSADLTTDNTSDTFLQNVIISEDGIATKTLNLAPQQQKKLMLSMVVAKNTAPADQYFSVIFLTMPEAPSEDSSMTSLRQGIAMPILVSLNGSNEVDASLDTYSSPIFLQNGPVPFTAKVKNSGDSFITVKGVILVTNMFGQTVGKIDIPSENILAGTTRALSNTTWHEKFLLGFYTATITLALSPKDILYTRSIHFVAFPFSFLVGLLTIIVLTIIIIRRIKKKVSEV